MSKIGTYEETEFLTPLCRFRSPSQSICPLRSAAPFWLRPPYYRSVNCLCIEIPRALLNAFYVVTGYQIKPGHLAR